MTTPRASLPFLKWTSTLEDLEPDTDDDIIDVTDYSERPSNDKRSPRPKQMDKTHVTTQGHCPTPQNSPTYLAMNAVAVAPAKPHRTEIWGILPCKRKYPMGGQHVCKVQYKLKVCNNPASKNMPHEEEYDVNNYESIDETAV